MKGNQHSSPISAFQMAVWMCLLLGAHGAAWAIDGQIDVLLDPQNTFEITEPGSYVVVDNVTMTADVTVCGLPPGLSWIHLSQPSNGSVAYLAPTFSWTSDGVPTCVYAVDFAIPQVVPFWSTYENMQILISQKYWEVPQSLWDQVPSGVTVYWRVRGADPADPPLDIITSDEVWTFQKY